MTPDDGPLPPPLPVRVRPAAGETVESYIRRLASANHLRPSLLHLYIRSRGSPGGAVRLPWLAAVSGSAPTALSRALTGLPVPGWPRAWRPASLETSLGSRAVRRALTASGELQPGRAGRQARITDPISHILDELASTSRTPREIWEIVTDAHESDASYSSIWIYTQARRHALQTGTPRKAKKQLLPQQADLTETKPATGRNQ